MALSPEELAATRVLLKEAKAALHQLMIGGMPVRVQDQSGESVSYSSASVSRLRAYIKELEAQIAAAGCGTLNDGPIRPVFL